MKLIKPNWVVHEGKSNQSSRIDCRGTLLAGTGQDMGARRKILLVLMSRKLVDSNRDGWEEKMLGKELEREGEQLASFTFPSLLLLPFRRGPRKSP